ncbi:MAG: tRNA uridine-5-carboxymethylaminomethyl(34) synthesis GTPase MnmE [Bdellovibrionales bacterium]|nr:tRNA uridine-5-carboxymethylaminomethyl(34) synthesis GTPase MnmE [Bdellovibrionales bacterium]
MQKQRHLDPAGYLSNRTIVALCSPTGGAISAVRISGADTHKIFDLLTGAKSSPANERLAKRYWLKDHAGRKIDDVIGVQYFAPKSFTGEDVVEIFIHGSPIIAQKLIDEVIGLGARVALPGEFSFRGVKNGKMRLSQAEAVKELVAAENDFSLGLALDKLSGTQHEFIEKIRNELMQLLALSEAGIDFSDQDLDEVSLPALKKRARTVLDLLTRLSGSFDRGKRFVDGIPVALFGLPNAGKSSFFNALLGEDRSIVSDIVGTTRDVVREKINLRTEDHGSTVTFRMADTAGIRKSQDQIENIGINRSVKSAQEADVVILIIDGKRAQIDEIFEAASSVDLSKKSLIAMLTKKDQMGDDEQVKVKAALQNKFKGISVHAVSSTTLDGIHDAARALARLGTECLKRKPGEIVLTQFEQVEAVNRAAKGLKEADKTADIVLFATEVRHAMNELGPLLGETVADDVLGKIFSDFCIGK